MNMGIKLDEIKDPAVRARYEEALSLGIDQKRLKQISLPPLANPKRIRQSGKALLNKLETEWFNLVKNRHPNFPPVRPQAKTFRLCNGVRFTPDLSVSSWPNYAGPHMETCWEVKGAHSWDDAIVKLKMAAHEYPEICWWLVWKTDGAWREQRILP